MSSAAVRAELVLRFAVRNGATFLAQQRSQAPLRVHRPFALGGGRALLQLVSVGPGPVGGDALALRIELAPGSRAVLLDQGATKVHGAHGVAATVDLDVRLGAGAELELYPGLIIPHPGAELRQRIRVELATAAKFALLERVSTGRRGGRGRFVRVSSELRLLREGELRYADRLELTPDTLGTGVLDGRHQLASGVWAWDGSFPEVAAPFVSGSAGAGIAYLRGTSELGLQRTGLFAAVDRWRASQDLGQLEWDRYRS